MNFSTEHWASHKRGKKKRSEISLYLSEHPNATPQEIAENVNLSIWQAAIPNSECSLRYRIAEVLTGEGFHSNI